MNQRRSLLALIAVVALLSTLLAAIVLGPARAQTSEEVWGLPVNVSRSGGASQPQVVAGPQGLVQVFWWDELDGLVTAYRRGGTWTDRAPAPIVSAEVVGAGENAQVVQSRIEVVPTIVEGADYAHALWVGRSDEATGTAALRHSRLAFGTTTWSEPQVIAEAARAWHMAVAPDGSLHVIYLRHRQTEETPAGIYYKRSIDGGVTWTDMVSLYESVYFRLVQPEDAHVWLATGDESRLYAAWDDPRRQEALLAVSADGGSSWLAPRTVGSDRAARRPRIALAYDVLLLWEESGMAGNCGFRQQRITMPITPTLVTSETVDLSDPRPVLEDLRSCPESPVFYRRAAVGPLLVLADQGLATSAWNGEEWAEPKSLTFRFEHPELGRPVYPEQLNTTLVGDTLAVVGVGEGDVWYAESVVNAWDWAFAPPPPWSTPEPVSQPAALSGLPALAADADGRLHAVWGDPVIGDASGSAPGGALTYARLEPVTAGAFTDDGPRWSQPVQVLTSPEGRPAQQPALVAYEDRLFAFWSGGQDGTIYGSVAFIRDAYGSGGWGEPSELPMGGVTASSPVALADAHGTLHLVYAAPLNEGRGIYYLSTDRSLAAEESGAQRRGVVGSWSDPQLVFDAQAVGFAAVDHPALAIDPAGTLHVAWVRGSSGGPFPPEAILYAQSGDGGQTWSQPRTLAEGAYDWPVIAAPVAGAVHVLWNQVDGEASWFHRWSPDYGQSWTYQQQVPGFRDVPGPAGLVTDGAGNLHLAGLAGDERDGVLLAYAFWRSSEERWEQHEPFGIGLGREPLPGLAAALQAAEGRLDVIFRAQLLSQEAADSEGPGVLHARRTVPLVAEEQEPAYTPVPTLTPLPSPTPRPTPTPRPAVQSEPPPPGPPIIGLGPITLPLVAIGGMGVALVIIAGVLLRRRAGQRG